MNTQAPAVAGNSRVFAVTVITVSVLCQLVPLGDAGATLRVRFITYRNPNSRDYENQACDVMFRTKCDNLFTFCLDTHRNDRQFAASDCSYGVFRTGEYTNRDDITFDGDMLGVANPIVVHIDNWQNVQLKVQVYDDDSHSANDLVDLFYQSWVATPAVNGTSRPPTSRFLMRGTRTSTHKTSLMVEFSVVCDQHYYGSDCRTYCRYKNNNRGHYRCTNSGHKLCLPGWESLQSSCQVRANDCEAHTCQNGATCEDGDRSYICHCQPGFTGLKCETEINECASSPCKNNGTCMDYVNSFQCLCPDSHPAVISPVCAIHTCVKNNPCLNGGTCHGAGLCHCPPNFTGSKCDMHFCEKNCITCRNGGVCLGDSCTCPLGTLGDRCEVRVCDVITCDNGGTCVSNGTCVCPPGYIGRYCHQDVDDCVTSPCANKARCVDGVASFTCVCGPGFGGALCEDRTHPVSPVRDKSPTTPVPRNLVNVVGHQTDKPRVAPVVQEMSRPMVLVLIMLVVALLLVIIVLIACMCRERLQRKLKHIRAAEAGTGATQAANFENPVYTMECSPARPDPATVASQGSATNEVAYSSIEPQLVTKEYLASLAAESSEYSHPPRGPARPVAQPGREDPMYDYPRPVEHPKPPPYSPPEGVYDCPAPEGAYSVVAVPCTVSVSDVKARLEEEGTYEELMTKTPLP